MIICRNHINVLSSLLKSNAVLRIWQKENIVSKVTCCSGHFQSIRWISNLSRKHATPHNACDGYEPPHLRFSLLNICSKLQSYHCCHSHQAANNESLLSKIKVLGKEYETDEWTNVTPHILHALEKSLHCQKEHPLCLIKDVIIQHFHTNYKRPRSPIFAVFDNISPVVTVEQNFDTMLIPKDHVSRKRSDNFYINRSTMLRAHTSAHEHELVRSGLNEFLIVGDVYRRDTVDATHFPAFHQVEAVRLYDSHQLFATSDCEEDLTLFEDGEESEHKQACHTLEASKLTEFHLKQTLENLVRELFGTNVEYKWVDAYFPFTHPSFEMEIKVGEEWVEMLGCGVLRQDILNSAGAHDRVGWAFGLGLERLAMKLFNIPDIRYFWTSDEAFLAQFRGHGSIHHIKFQPMVSKQPAVSNDISFWLPASGDSPFSSNDFYDVVRSADANGLVESVSLADVFTNHKTGRTSHCYRIFYRHLTRPLTQQEVSVVDATIKQQVVEQLNVTARW